MYTMEEVMNFTVKDIQRPDLVDVKVEGWLELTPEQRERCIMKLRDLVRQRDEMAKSDAVDAKALEEKLKHISSRSSLRASPSQTPTPPFPDPNDPEEIQRVLKIEEDAYKALVDERGIPSHPIDLGFDVLGNPGQYEAILSYWQGEPGNPRLSFLAQLNRWREFRAFQQKIRRYHIQQGTFPYYQQKVLERRRKRGLNGDVELLEDQDKQSKLVNWMEYQDHQHQIYESFEKDLEEAQAQLKSRKKALAEAGVPGFEAVQELDNFATYYSLAVENGNEESKAWDKMTLAEQKLRLAETRLKTAQLDDLGETVERATWIGLFLKEVQSARIRLGKVPDYLPGGAYCRREGESEEEWWKAEMKRREENRLRYNAEFQAWQEVGFAEEGLKAARSDDFGETVRRAALIKMVQEEILSAQAQFKESKELAEKTELRGKVISALDWVPSAKRNLERHKILLQWIERQRREITTGCADTEKEGNQGQAKRARSRTVQNHVATKASRPKRFLKVSGSRLEQPTARSILSPIGPSKVSKAPRKKLSSRRKLSVSYNTPQAVEKATIDPSALKSRSERASRVPDVAPTSLRPIHSSKVSKPGSKPPTGLHKDGTKPPPTTGGHRKSVQQSVSANTLLRRSTRISKKPERFCPGYT
ncbi:MAG: hypothetical protein M1816_004723 [Peltula sp. TS41687]|nr:MAG: hypothetical protein M1816_004723 [Peltula sp. TS41687]